LHRKSNHDVFTDGRMPIIDGIQLSKSLQKLATPPKVYMITGHARADDEEELLNYGIR
jgi:CheY-like chemotaxis protein